MDQALMEQFQTSMTEIFFQELTTDVFDKYEIVEEIRDGEFGPIYKVRPKDPSIHTVRVYSLKTVHLNRVSRLDRHQREIVNEISALKVSKNVLVHSFRCVILFCEPPLVEM